MSYDIYDPPVSLVLSTPSKDTRRRRVYSQIKEEKEEKEKEGEKKEIVNGIYKPYILIEWRFVNWSMLIYNIPLIFICFLPAIPL